MTQIARELLFDSLLLLAVILAQSSYMLGIGTNPFLTLLIEVALLGIGVLTAAPRETRVSTAVIGILGLGLAGAAVPRYAARAARPSEMLWLSLLLAGVVFLLTFGVLRLTTFGLQATQTA